MLRKIILYFKSLSCEHEWEKTQVAVYKSLCGTLPNGYIQIYRCTKCGYVKKINIGSFNNTREIECMIEDEKGGESDA